MKLSEIRGERTLDVIADIIEPIANIAENKECLKLFKKQKAPEGVDPRTFAVQRLKRGIPAIIKAHKTDMIAIFAAIDGVTPEEYAENLSLFSLLKDATDLVTDEAFVDLFMSAQNEKGAAASGAAQANTEAHGV